ncbi:pyrroline-5-carboxylate reductase [Microbacterium schleiferi]|uniref:pyrroline-5-carboxylate reductase n=1 Tax=Microbacterium schleiferi TaxID=69362 RepID=UPI00311EB7EB
MASSAPSFVVAVLGAGSMGGAIARGVAASGTADVIATNRSGQKAALLAGLPGIRSYALEEYPERNRISAAEADVILVGVKPAMVPELLCEIAPSLRPGAIVVSLAAGVTTATYEALLPESVAVLRSMPNTPALVSRAVTGLAAGSRTSEADRARVRGLFETVGVVVEVDEEQIDALGTISGSGPAYVYLLIEELARAAEGKGFSPEQARLLVEQTFIGAGALLEASGEDPRELRRQVTSPKGTTERAIAVLQDADLGALFGRATDAALARSRELAAGA